MTGIGRTIRQKQITKLALGAYDFIVSYAELHDERTKDFWHSHSCYELFYVSAGELEVTFEDEELLMKSGDILLVPPHTSHHVPNEPGVGKRLYFVLCFEFRLVKSRLSHLPSEHSKTFEIDTLLSILPQGHYKYCPAGWDADIFLDQISMELSEKKFGWTMYTNMLYYGFFLNAIRHVISVENEYPESDDALNLAIEATKYIHAHYSENVTLDKLAAYLHISTRQGNRIFRKMFNTTFGETLRAIRLTYTKALLTTTDLSVEEIAERVGFSSAQALRKLFKQSEGMTISQYRDAAEE